MARADRRGQPGNRACHARLSSRPDAGCAGRRNRGGCRSGRVDLGRQPAVAEPADDAVSADPRPGDESTPAGGRPVQRPCPGRRSQGARRSHYPQLTKRTPIMTAEPNDGEHDDAEPGAEVVPLHPAAPQDADPDLLPAVPADAGTELGNAPARAIYADITSSEGERRQIIPARLRRENVRATAASQAGLFWHRVRYQALRSPLYLVAVLVWAVVGAVRLAGRQARWGG